MLNHEYGDSHYWRPCILTEKVDHWSGSLGNEASYWAYETWKNIRDLTSKSLKTNPNTFDNRLQASCQCANNHSNRCSDCEYNSWGYETVDLEYVSRLVTCFLQVLLNFIIHKTVLIIKSFIEVSQKIISHTIRWSERFSFKQILW